MAYHAFTIRDVAGRVHCVNLSDDRRLPPAMDGGSASFMRRTGRDQEDDPDSAPGGEINAAAIVDAVAKALTHLDAEQANELRQGLHDLLNSATTGGNGESGTGMDTRRGARNAPASFPGMPRVGGGMDAALALDQSRRSLAKHHPDIAEMLDRIKTHGY
jgi:hypothetical protein